MIDKDSLNYGVLYSFEPDFLKHVTDEEPHPQFEEDNASYQLDMVDTKGLGILGILITLVMIGLVAALLKTPSKIQTLDSPKQTCSKNCGIQYIKII